MHSQRQAARGGASSEKRPFGQGDLGKALRNRKHGEEHNKGRLWKAGSAFPRRIDSNFLLKNTIQPLPPVSFQGIPPGIPPERVIPQTLKAVYRLLGRGALSPLDAVICERDGRKDAVD